MPPRKKVPRIDRAILEQLEGEIHPAETRLIEAEAKGKREITVNVEPIDVRGLDAYLTGASPEPLGRVAIALTWFAWTTADLEERVFEQMIDHVRMRRRKHQLAATAEVAACAAKEQ